MTPWDLAGTLPAAVSALAALWRHSRAAGPHRRPRDPGARPSAAERDTTVLRYEAQGGATITLWRTGPPQRRTDPEGYETW
ncbi:hypothetical protein [Streptomyces sp. NPDC006879]|uniref:hypothetical protein n=1 Tax=Streptomyces sp. NPDC006879 TaxID=3364767 RepID=UPI0036B4DBAF